MNRHDFNNEIMSKMHKSKIKHNFDRDEKLDLTSCFIGDDSQVAFAWDKENISIHTLGRGGGVVIPFDDLTDISSSHKSVQIKFTGGDCNISEDEDEQLWLSCAVTKVKRPKTETRPQRTR